MSINAGSISAELLLKSDGFFRDLNRANTETQNFSGKLKSMGGAAVSAGKTMTKGLTVPIVGIGVVASKLAMDFESGMSEVSALSGATGSDLKLLEDKAREMGSSTIYSATESAEALKYMALAGWDTKQMAEGLEPSLKLAGATNMELGQATDIVTDVMSMFGMEAEEATKMTDMLAYAQANSNTSVEQLGDALVYSGASANAMGYDLAETSAILGVFGDQGLKGSKAGTTLNAVFRDMKKEAKDGAIAIGDTNVAIVDAEGNYKSMGDILVDVEKATDGMSASQRDAALSTVFGSQAMQGMNMMLEAGSETLIDFESDIRNSDGAAGDMYDTMQDNLKGALAEMKSALEEAGLALGETLIPMLRDGAEWVSELAGKFNALDDSTKETIVQAGLLLAAAGPLLIVGGTLFSGIGSIVGVAGSLISSLAGIAGAGTAATGVAATAGGTGIAGIGSALGAALIPIAPFVLAAAGIATVGYGIYKTLSEETIPEVDLFADTVETTGSTITTSAEEASVAVEEAGGVMAYANELTAESIIGVGEQQQDTTVVISDATKEAVQHYVDMERDVKEKLFDLYVDHTEITADILTDVEEGYTAMTEYTVGELNERKEEEIRIYGELFDGVSTLSKTEQAEILKGTQDHYDTLQRRLEAYDVKILNEYEHSLDEQGRLTEEGHAEIARLEAKKKELSIKVLSETEVESTAIIEKLKASDERITAEMASEKIKQLNELKTEAVSIAEAQYEEDMGFIIKERDETGTITSEQADSMIADAKRRKEGTVREAEYTAEGSIDAIFGMNSELENNVDASTGEIVSMWQRMMGTWDRWTPGNKVFRGEVFITETHTTIRGSGNSPRQPGQGNAIMAHGTEHFAGGYTWVGEQGRELVKLPKGTGILSNPKSEKKVSEGRNITQNITLNSPKHLSPSETSRKHLQVSRRLAAEWGV